MHSNVIGGFSSNSTSSTLAGFRLVLLMDMSSTLEMRWDMFLSCCRLCLSCCCFCFERWRSPCTHILCCFLETEKALLNRTSKLFYVPMCLYFSIDCLTYWLYRLTVRESAAAVQWWSLAGRFVSRQWPQVLWSDNASSSSSLSVCPSVQGQLCRDSGKII